MNKKVLLAFLMMFFTGNCVMQAQDDIDDEDEFTVTDDFDEEDEITVTDENGDEEIIDLPEAMTYDLDSLLNLYMNNTYLSEDENCRMKDFNPTFSKEEYIDRLSRIPAVMEMPHNDAVQQCIDRYAGRLRRSVSLMLGASNFYMPIFEEALEAYGLPLELRYLPIIESALNPKAVSRAGAAGLWQFMPTTGKQYGLKLNSLVDERRDPIKASYAAAHLLRDLYKVFGDWNLVIAAYNCGPGNINKAITRSGGKRDYWAIYPYLPRETRGYVPAFIAANYIMTYYCDHNICPMQTRLPLQSDTIMINRNVHLQQIADVCGINIEELRTLNPSYRRDIIPGATEPCILRLAQADVTKFLALEDSIYNYRNDELLSRRATVSVPDDVPTYYHSRKTFRSSRHGRYSKHDKRSKYYKKRKGSRDVVSKKKGRGKHEAPVSKKKKKGRNNGTASANTKKKGAAASKKKGAAAAPKKKSGGAKKKRK